jgi:hypothetical protein
VTIPSGDTVAATYANLAAFLAAVNPTQAGQQVRLVGHPHAKAITRLTAVSFTSGTLAWTEGDD